MCPLVSFCQHERIPNNQSVRCEPCKCPPSNIWQTLNRSDSPEQTEHRITAKIMCCSSALFLASILQAGKGLFGPNNRQEHSSDPIESQARKQEKDLLASTPVSIAREAVSDKHFRASTICVDFCG
jgi:hypothetical protein